MSGRPAGMTQRQVVETMLRQQGQASAHELTYRYGITRSAAVIHTLRMEGWGIDTTTDDGHQAVYHLRHTPPDTEPAAVVQAVLWENDLV